MSNIESNDYQNKDMLIHVVSFMLISNMTSNIRFDIIDIWLISKIYFMVRILNLR